MSDSPADSRGGRIRPKPRWGRRLGVAALLLAGIIVAVHWGLGRSAENKLNRQVAAYRAAGEPMSAAEITRLDADDVADADNAAVALRSAAARVDEDSEAWQAYEALDKDLPYWESVRPPLTGEEVKRLRAVVAANQAALAEATQATTKPGVNWKIDFATPMILAKLPDLNPQRRLARLLDVAAMLAHHDGDDAEALRRVREMLFISRAVDRQPTLVSHLVSLGISAMAVERLSQIAPELRVTVDGQADARSATPQQVRELIAEMLDDRPVHEGRRRALRGERASQLDTATGIAYGTLAVDDVAGSNKDARTPEETRWTAALTGYVLKPAALNDALIMIRYATGLIESGTADDLPALRAKLPRFPAEVKGGHILHMVAAILMPSIDRAIEQDFRHLASRHMAAVALATRSYALEHDGKLPERLEDLVPKYLPKVPVDPLAAGGSPLRYLPGDKPLVYSVGENGRDDGGKELPPTASRKEMRETSDEVVHLKRQPRPPKPVEPAEPAEPAEPQELEAARELLLPGTP